MIDKTILIEQLNKKKWELPDFIQFDDEGLTPSNEECYNAGRRQGRHEAFSETIQMVEELRDNIWYDTDYQEGEDDG